MRVVVETVYKGRSEFLPLVILKPRLDFCGFVAIILKHLLRFKKEIPQRIQKGSAIWNSYPNKHKKKCISSLSKVSRTCLLASKESTTPLLSPHAPLTAELLRKTLSHLTLPLSFLTWRNIVSLRAKWSSWVLGDEGQPRSMTHTQQETCEL